MKDQQLSSGALRSIRLGVEKQMYEIKNDDFATKYTDQWSTVRSIRLDVDGLFYQIKKGELCNGGQSLTSHTSQIGCDKNNVWYDIATECAIVNLWNIK